MQLGLRAASAVPAHPEEPILLAAQVQIPKQRAEPRLKLSTSTYWRCARASMMHNSIWVGSWDIGPPTGSYLSRDVL